MNPNLARLHPYPFEKLSALKAGLTPPADRAHIALSIGEPQHPVPAFVTELVREHVASLARYPSTVGEAALREAIAAWAMRRYHLPALDPERQVLPVSGTREALFALAQCVIDPSDKPLVLMPNPFYQIYEGAALLAGAEPYYVDCREELGFQPDYGALPEAVWKRCRLLYLCSPGNPTGAVAPAATLAWLLEQAERYDFVIAADECYAEIYPDEARPPLGMLEACARSGRNDFRRVVVFHSLSKRSNLPGLRSGFVAGDAALLERFRLYRTYHGCALSPLAQAVSRAAWADETHVQENRSLYRKKFQAVLDILEPLLHVGQPDAAFYLWPALPVDDETFARELYARENVTVLPGRYLARGSAGGNPGRNRVRLALVASLADCVEAAHRIRRYLAGL
ncbi:MAG TPA: succinyldiaminopimelate transaminase [Candidatus Competibacteraceae bacterium]|nr:succinyldiaminopimelate transaminase [Candidatus Competibacteraceae bacterium]